jgi:hypothetical protein
MTKWTKPVHISKETFEQLKQHCLDNGLLMGFTVDKLITEYLKEK